MGTPVTAWDAQGNPIQSTRKPATAPISSPRAWDASGNPITPPSADVTMNPKQAQDAADALIYSHLTGAPPSYTFENHDAFKESLADRLGSYAEAGWEGLTKESIIGEWTRGKVPAPFETHDEIGKFVEGLGKMAADIPIYLAGGVLGAVAGGAAGTAELPVVGTIAGSVVGAGAGSFALTEGMRQWLVDKYSDKKISSFEEALDIVKAAGKGALTGAAFGVAGEAAPVAEGVVGKYLGARAYKTAAELATMTTVGSLLEGKVPSARDFLENAALMAVMHVGMNSLRFAKESAPEIQDRSMQIYGRDGVHPADLAIEAGRRAIEEAPADNPIEVISKIENEIAAIKPEDASEGSSSEESPEQGQKAAIPAREEPPSPAGEGETGIKNATTEADRAERGLPEVEVEARRSLGQSFDTAKEAVDSGSVDPRALAEEMSKNPRALNAEESAALIYDRMRLQNEHANVMDGIEDARAKGDVQRESRERDRMAKVEDAINTNDEAARRTGYEQGLGLAARRMMIKQDYSLANVMQRARVASEGKEIPPALRNRLEDLTQQLSEANKRIDAYEEAKKQSAAQQSVEKIKLQEGLKQRSGKRAANKEALKTERVDLYKQLNAELMQLSANPIFNPKLYELFGKLAVNHIRDGVTTIEGIVDAIHTEIQERGISKREIRDYISQYGRESEARTRSDIENQLAEARKQGKLISAIEDADKGQKPAKGKRPEVQDSERVKELRQQLDEAMRNSGLIEEPDPARGADKEKSDPQQSKLKAYKKQLQNRISAMEKQLSSGDFTKPTRQSTILDQEAQELKAQAEKIKGQVDQAIARHKYVNSPPLQKGLAIFQKWRRGILISSASVGGKIANASMQRFGVTPIEELVGGVLSKFPGLSDIADKAPREGGGLNITAEAKAIGNAFSGKTAEDMWEVLKTGKGSLDYLYGKKTLGPTSLVDFVGHIHGALQTPILRAEFARSMEKRAQWAIDNGLDVQDPKVQATLAGDAYVDANRAVFRQENFINTAFRMVMKYLESKGLSGKSVKFMTETILPIVKLPVNVVGEGLNYTAGTVSGSIQVLSHVLSKGGLDGLTMHEADNIMRAFKKGSVGLGILAMGYYAGHHGGIVESSGFYQRGNKNKPIFSVGGVELPTWMLDTPVGLTFQVGATMRRVNDAYAEKGKSGGFVAGAVSGLQGELKKVPFVSAAKDVAQMVESPDSAGLFIGDLIESLVVPPDVKKIAETIDDGTKRKPTNIVESVEAGVPGLRENVPVAKKKGKKFSIRGSYGR